MACLLSKYTQKKNHRLQFIYEQTINHETAQIQHVVQGREQEEQEPEPPSTPPLPRTGSLGSQGKESHNPEGSTQQAAHKVRVEMVKAEHKVKIKMVKVRVSSRGGRGGAFAPPCHYIAPPWYLWSDI